MLVLLILSNIQVLILDVIPFLGPSYRTFSTYNSVHAISTISANTTYFPIIFDSMCASSTASSASVL